MLRDLMQGHPALGQYGGWYVIAGNRLVGFCGFKGPPDPHGRVEIGYSIAAPHQRNGYARRAVALLVARASADPIVTGVVAKTLPQVEASRRVLDAWASVRRAIENTLNLDQPPSGN
jgi:ribosomal-protein-alanine N-acetyltransferase